ncbi:hypothetical protein VTL71DRAFT_7032 [Oculimacula yallundae]|uniref:Uncharacterized protein n=1 Tax=Oculimacula yallundae TaxID=86028 RepID=A0ABR4BVJ3_9HELO
MSTDVHPSQTPAPTQQSQTPTPPPRSSSWHPSSLFPKHNRRNKTPPPASLTTQGERRHRRRSSSLGGALAKLKPSNRAERGGTLRDQRDGWVPFEMVGGMESVNGGNRDVLYSAALADDARYLQGDLGSREVEGRTDEDIHANKNLEYTSLASSSVPASWNVDRSQREWSDRVFSHQRISRGALPVGSPTRPMARDSTRLFEPGFGRDPISTHIAKASHSSNPERAYGSAFEELATSSGPTRASETANPRPLGFSDNREASEHIGRAERPDSAVDRSGRNSEGEFNSTIPSGTLNVETRGANLGRAEAIFRRKEANDGIMPGTSGTGTTGRDGHGSGRGNGLKKLLGSWGRKTNREELNGSPDIDRLKKPLPALPAMAPEDLGFQISILNFSDEKQITTAQQTFEDKKNRRLQRRSLKESGDYLGVQGANPRTGYWDVSSGSEPSQISEETKRKLDEEALEVAERKRRYEEAEKKHRVELQRVQTMRENKKKMEKKMKQRRRGKWQLSENGWSSVAEPNLSPIMQSVVGTPVAGSSSTIISFALTDLDAELSPEDRLFPMPSAADPAPYINPFAIKEKDYFSHRNVSSPLKKEQRSTEAISTYSIPRKPVGSPTRRQDNDSTHTTIHNPAISVPLSPAPGTVSIEDRQKARTGLGISLGGGNVSPKPLIPSSPRSPSQRLEAFLERAAQMEDSGDPHEKRASVISFQSVSTKQVQIHRPSGQNQRNPSRQARIITCLDELPPVKLKDPFTASIPLNSPAKQTFQVVWMPPTIIKTESDHPRSSTNMFITTTTGSDLALHLPAQLDGQDSSEDQAKMPSLQHKPSRLPLRVDSFQDTRERKELSGSYQTQPADTVTSSVHKLGETKERTARLCQMVSPEGEKVEMKNTPIFISTSLSPEKDKQAARNAAQMAFQHLRHTLAVNKAERQNKDQLTPPKTRKQKEEVKGLVPGGKEGIGSPSRTDKQNGIKREPPISTPNRKKPESEDRLVVHHPHPAAPKADNAGKSKAIIKGAGMKAVVLHQAGGKSPVRIPPGKQARATQLSIDKALFGLLQNAWLFVEPVFNPDSEVRKRFDRQALTGQDVGLFIAAALFCFGGFIGLLVCARTLGVVVQALKGFGGLVRAVIGV